MLKALIVDDEQLSVKRLKRLLTERGDIEVCHTFLEPLDAYKFVKNHPVDVAFLDISMPKINGLKLSSLLRDLDDSIAIVFVTGYDKYAVQAFDVNALDYLMKPVVSERLAQTLDKIRKIRRNTMIAPSVTVQMFDGFNLYIHDREPLKLRSPKTEELFAFLICKGTVSRIEVIEALWGELEVEKASKNLNSTLYYIRKAMNEHKLGSLIQSNKYDIRVDKSAIYCDLYEFELLLKQVRSVVECEVDLWNQVEVLYTGEFLKGKSYEWAIEKTRQLEKDYIELLEGAARYYMKHLQPHNSLYYYGKILELDPLREDIHYDIIRLYMGLGRKQEAYQQYRTLEKMLGSELGTTPNPRITNLITNSSNQSFN